MAKRILAMFSYTPTGTTDGATNLADNTYSGFIQGGSSTQRINHLEFYLGGQAGASSPTFMFIARDTQVVTGATTVGLQGADSPLDAATAALAAPPLAGVTAATNKPQRSPTGHLLNLSFNAFGGIVRWVAAPGEEITTVGNTQPLGELSFSCGTGGTPGLLGSHWIYEPF